MEVYNLGPFVLHYILNCPTFYEIASTDREYIKL